MHNWYFITGDCSSTILQDWINNAIGW